MANEVEEFNAYREKMNTKILAENNTVIKRIFNLDTNAFKKGALDTKTKELLGLVASTESYTLITQKKSSWISYKLVWLGE